MKRRLLAACASLLLLSFMPPAMLAATAVDQSNPPSNTGLCDSFTFYAQTFTAGKTGPLMGIDLYVAFGNSDDIDLGVEIDEVDGSTGLPVGSALDTSDVEVPANFSGLEHFALSGNTIVSAGTKYAIEIGEWNGDTLVADPFKSICAMFGNSYAGGQGFTWSYGSPPTWDSVGDWAFQTYVNAVNVGPLDHLALNPSGSSIAAGAGQAYTATGYDSQGNSLGDVTSATTFTIDSGTACPAHMCSSTRTGSHTVTGRDGSATGTTTLHVTPSNATHLTVSAGASAVVGTADSVTVTAKDAYGNVATGFLGRVHFTSSDAAAVKPADYTFSASDKGVHAFSMTFKTVGTQSVTATDTVTATIRGTQGGIFVTPAPIPATYHPIAPVRLLDTRVSPTNGHSGKLTAGVPITFPITGRTDRTPTIPSGASAVTGNLTVTNSSGPWAVYLGPNPVAAPSSSTINFTAGQTIANGLTVALSATGQLSATYMGPSGATTDLVFDVTGFYTPNSTGQTYHPIAPVRDVDTRAAGSPVHKLTASAPACFSVAGVNNVPLAAKAVTGNVTVANPTSAWALYLGPLSTSAPTTSTLNFLANQVASNNVTVALSASGQLCATYMGPAGATTDLVFDVTGFYTADLTGASFLPITPVRLLDTRATPTNGLAGKFGAASPRTFAVSARGSIPVGAAAVTGNLTVTDETAGWAIYLGPAPLTAPKTSSLNFIFGDVKANGVSVALSPAGSLSATYMGPSGGSTNLVFDATGYFMK